LRRKVTDQDGYLRELVGKVEEVGVLVLRSGVVENNTHRKLDVTEFRGFAINDDIAPLVFINGSDARSAQIFTLLHELAHLWIGESAISESVYRSPMPANASERLCNQIAAEVLVPAKELRMIWDNSAHTSAAIDDVARRF